MKTARIDYRPVCPARTPLSQDAAFYATITAAQIADHPPAGAAAQAPPQSRVVQYVVDQRVLLRLDRLALQRAPA